MTVLGLALGTGATVVLGLVLLLWGERKYWNAPCAFCDHPRWEHVEQGKGSCGHWFPWDREDGDAGECPCVHFKEEHE